ncbi:hypothetical protein J2X02_002903 [Pseudoxanthomonas japonensis]|uniref:hypothetical protein n=1 Tax=Pseudoxanthomonas japonensis TaxID=69284 RepID=UPI00285CEF0B|nr:hypothetical protein [Pseudoxanthomonas japonensis]MDR7070052.1 hypothetical protein [Pseudoxanthomonas japonensis]
MKMNRVLGGPSMVERECVYAALGLSERSTAPIEEMIRNSGLRDVAKSALTNVRTALPSGVNGAARVLESHTCELIFARELELDPTVIGYYVQVPLQNIERTTIAGRRHISSANIDFLVFRGNYAELVECKTQEWLSKAALRPHSDWSWREDQWFHEPYIAAAEVLGLPFRTWTPPFPHGIYGRNLEAIHATLDDFAAPDLSLMEQVKRLLATRPASIESISKALPSFGLEVALWMLARRLVYGPITSLPIDQADRFLLCASSEQAKEIDALHLANLSASLAQPDVCDPILTASTTDVNRALGRLRKIEDFEAGRTKGTVRLRQLIREVAIAVDAGKSPLSACLTNYSKSGNRVDRIDKQQMEAVQAAIEIWNRGGARNSKELEFVFEEECARREVDSVGIHASTRYAACRTPNLAHSPSAECDPFIRFGRAQILDIEVNHQCAMGRCCTSTHRHLI